MFKILCPNCNAENKFQSRSDAPAECSFCWESIPHDIHITSDEDNREITGLTIIYQITQQRIEISTLQKTILGRSNYGSEVLSTILYNGGKVISGTHCSIEYKSGNFYLLDEGSTNGTFYGVNKRDCKGIPQIIEDGGIIWLGREAFLAQINHKEAEEQEHKMEEIVEEIKVIKFYRCNDCGFESQTEILDGFCPKCDTFGTLIPIY